MTLLGRLRNVLVLCLVALVALRLVAQFVTPQMLILVGTIVIIVIIMLSMFGGPRRLS